MKVRDIIEYLKKDYPEDLAYEWDNVGLQVGSVNASVDQLLITLDVTLEVINEAIMIGATMIVAHHPMIFRPLSLINTDLLSGQMIALLLKHDIALYVMHTNYDVSNKGMNQMLADKLALKNQQIVELTTEEEGLGRFGTVDEMTLEELANHVKMVFNVSHVRIIGPKQQLITTVAIVGGSGSSVIASAVDCGVDVLITGDITYHHALDMKSSGLLGIDAGHHIEVAFVDALEKQLASLDESLMVVKSKINTNPYEIV